MPEDLKAFIAEMARRPFVWGEHDCSLIVADWWVVRNGGADPAAALRGTYSTAEECAALVAAGGGLEAIMSGLADTVSAPEKSVAQAVPGDFGTLTFADGIARGVICSAPGRWVTKAERGVHMTTLTPSRVWAI